jgi:hypothetical protein
MSKEEEIDEKYKMVGDTKQITQQKSFCKKDATYEINWFYTTNLSGNNRFPFTGKQIPSLKQEIKDSPLQFGDMVQYMNPEHPNFGLKAQISKIILPLSDIEIAELGRNKEEISNEFPPVYELTFINMPLFLENLEKTIKVIDKNFIKKIPAYKTKICINWRKEFFYHELKKIKTKDKKQYKKEIDALITEYNRGSSSVLKNDSLKKEILEKKIKEKMNFTFTRNSVFVPDAIQAWESKNFNKTMKNDLIPPDDNYYIMTTSIIDVENTSLINKDQCSNNKVPPYYKIWVVIKVNLRKEALTLAKDLLLNSKVFLDCDGKKEKFFEIIRDIKNETKKTADKLVSNFTNNKSEDTKGCEDYKYPDLPKKEDMKEYNEQLQQVDINSIPIYTINTLIKLRSPDPNKYRWKNEVDAKIIKMNKDRTYNVALKYDSSTIKNVRHIYITPVNNVKKGGYRKSRKYKRQSKKRRTKRRKRK